MPRWELHKPRENPATDQDKIHNVVLYKTEGVYEARRLANTISDGRTGKLLEAKEQGELKRTGIAIGPLMDVLKAAKNDGVTLVRAKFARGETGDERIKVLYIHPIRGIWQQMKFSALHYRFPSRPFPWRNWQEDTGLRLWLDDIRPAPDVWRWIRTVEGAIELMSSGEVVEASLDHDLGDGKQEGYKLVLWMAENDVWTSDAISVHSSNLPGSERMCGVIERYSGYRRFAGRNRFISR